jgi:hypothetical protein
MRSQSLFAAAVFAVGLCCAAGAVRAERFAGEFMAMGGGARALGMGAAFCAVADDASAVYFNPAGLSGFDKRQALFMHSERFGDELNYNFAAFAAPTDILGAGREASFGFAVIHLGAPDIPITSHIPFTDVNGDGVFTPNVDRVDPSGIRLENANDFAVFGSFASNTSYGRLGGSLKVIYSDQVAGYSATGIGIDLGYMKRGLWDRLDVGVKLQDATGTYISWSSGTTEFIAPSVKVGAAYRIDAPSFNGAALLTFDSDFYFEDRRGASQFWASRYSADLHFGTEIILQERVMIRGGFDTTNPTAGAGFRLGIVGFDYAYLHHDDFEATHRISGMVDF